MHRIYPSRLSFTGPSKNCCHVRFFAIAMSEHNGTGKLEDMELWLCGCIFVETNRFPVVIVFDIDLNLEIRYNLSDSLPSQ